MVLGHESGNREQGTGTYVPGTGAGVRELGRGTRRFNFMGPRAGAELPRPLSPYRLVRGIAAPYRLVRIAAPRRLAEMLLFQFQLERRIAVRADFLVRS